MDKISFDTLKFLLKEGRDKGSRVQITFHSFGDSDSISSAIALSDYFPNSMVIGPDIITHNAERILSRLGFDQAIIKNSFDDKADISILVDVNNFEDCGAFRYRLESFKGSIIIIDHHSIKEIPQKNVSTFNDESFNSAASIVYRALKELGHQFKPNIAKLLLSGIISDSAEFRNSTAETFVQVGELLTAGKTDYASFQEEIIHIAEPEARTKTLEDVINAKREIQENLLFIHGKAHAHANLAADVAIRIGADAAFFYTQNDKEFSMSARLRAPLDKVLGIHLGAIMKAIGPQINGTGGGHPCAAGAYGPPVQNPEKIEEILVQKIIEKARGAKR